MYESGPESFRKPPESSAERDRGITVCRMKRSIPALIAAVLVATTLTTTTTAAAAPSARPVAKCEFTPTPENPAAKPVRVPSPVARAKGTVDVLLKQKSRLSIVSG